MPDAGMRQYPSSRRAGRVAVLDHGHGMEASGKRRGYIGKTRGTDSIQSPCARSSACATYRLAEHGIATSARRDAACRRGVFMMTCCCWVAEYAAADKATQPAQRKPQARAAPCAAPAAAPPPSTRNEKCLSVDINQNSGCIVTQQPLRRAVMVGKLPVLPARDMERSAHECDRTEALPVGVRFRSDPELQRFRCTP